MIIARGGMHGGMRGEMQGKYRYSTTVPVVLLASKSQLAWENLENNKFDLETFDLVSEYCSVTDR